ncbi:MAG: ADP-forming succinate--CoA ligase subunit beta [Planctomycetes bacterium]|nr:ADP-forming succinate--CoA ligase subunit beta [Planctomycetota bacterium]
MNVHEHQAKEILRRYGVAVPRGEVAATAEEAAAAFQRLAKERCVVKAQVLAGGRGKAGGIKVADSPDAARRCADEILRTPLVTRQTGRAGRMARRVLVEECVQISRELYLGMTLDRSAASPVVIASAEGGVEIEELAKTRPERILRERVDLPWGLQAFQARRLAVGLGLGGSLMPKAVNLMLALSRAFIENDCSLVEINPLALTAQGDVLALDAKMSFDDNALHRHADLAAVRDPDELTPQEAEAAKDDLSYIGLDGNIGCMVNGAGLAMATMDIIKLHGGAPANFLDVGGGASVEKVRHAFRLLLSDPRVQAVLVNIFGGIMKCDVIAQGILDAVKGEAVRVPLVVRLEGTNVDAGRRLLAASGLNITPATSMSDAAAKVVAAARA